MLVHKFDTKQIADDAMKYLNLFHKLPVTDGHTIYTEKSYKINPNGGFYIEYDEIWTKCLGEPIEITLPTNNNE